MKDSATSEQLNALTKILEQGGTTSARFQEVLDCGILEDILDPEAELGNREAVREALKLGPLKPGTRPGATEGFKLEVDYGASLEQMIATGKYDWLNDDISQKQFQITGAGQAEFEARLFNFERGISSEDAEKGIREADHANPWEPAKIEHLLAFGAKYPEAQRANPIIALGSVTATPVFGHRSVPYLYRRVTGRSLHLDWWGNGWHPFYRFLGVRKIGS